ncbi:hypothetical protein FACS1894180_1890 [Bacteroidia bacterium]|nr:hypothetical protein FACS1894180_1890 [Bacteroidia bacterium]
MENQNFGLQMELPNSKAVMICGILSIPCCGLIGVILAIISLVMAKSANELYLNNSADYTESSYKNLKTGKICATIGLILGILGTIASIIYYVWFFNGGAQTLMNYGNY